jgi:hypothetical protein
MKYILLTTVLIIFNTCNIFSQDLKDTSDAKEIDISLAQTKTDDVVTTENKLLSVNEIIKKTRNSIINQRKKLNSYNLHVFSKSLMQYHLINNLIQLFTDYSGTDYNFLGANESEMMKYFKIKGKSSERKIIVESHRQTELLDKTATYYFYPDFFAEKVNVINETLPGPLGPDCFDNYNYKLVKIDSSSGRKIYQIRIQEKYKYIPSLNGTIYIEDSTFALKKASLKTNLAINIPLIKEVRLNNTYNTYLDSNTMQLYSIPAFINIKATASVAGAVKLKLDSYLETRSVIINKKQNNVKYDEFEIVVKPNVINKSKEYWEKNGIKLNDSLVSKEFDKINEEKFKSKSFVTYTGTGIRFGESLTWNFLYSYTFNRIEGNHIELNTTFEKNFKRFLLNSRIVYGTASDQFKYRFNLEVIPTKIMNFLIKAELFSYVTPLFKKIGWFNYFENAYSTLITKKDRVNYFNEFGYRVGADYRISGIFTIGADFLQDKQSSVSNNTNFSFFRKDENYATNPQINDGLIRKVSLNLNVDFNRYRMIDWGDGDVSRLRLSLLPVMEFRYSYSDKKILKSDFDIREYHVKVTGSILLGRAFNVIYKAGATLKYGTVPYQELLAIDPKFVGLPNDISMIVPDYSEFLGDRIVFLNIENEFGKIFPFNVPVLSSITLLGDICFGKTWISDENRELSPDKRYKTTDGWFTEIGVGLTRILEICTLRYSVRLNNYKEGSNSFLFFDVGIRY